MDNIDNLYKKAKLFYHFFMIENIIGENEYIHLKALKDLPAKGGKVTLRNVADGIFKLEDPIK